MKNRLECLALVREKIAEVGKCSQENAKSVKTHIW
jgi:hypothetical protein